MTRRRRQGRAWGGLVAALTILTGAPVSGAGKVPPPGLSADSRATQVLRAMTADEKLQLVRGYFGTPATMRGASYRPPAEALSGSAGYVPGIARLGVPPLWETDAGLGVATQASTPDAVRERTALPSGLASAATWNPALVARGGGMIGSEARNSGFNVLLAGGINLLREPRNGRNFEYAGEDPLLAGVIVGAAIRGIQSVHLMSTIKHFALNDQESGRTMLNVRIADDEARMSDLLAFQIAIEQSHPAAVMCAYNRVNGPYSCENATLLTRILKDDWGYPGFVMSDWGATHSTVAAAMAGLDQESASTFDDEDYFGDPLRRAVATGTIPPARIDDMVWRILRAMFISGIIDDPVKPAPIDFAADAAVSLADAEQALVLLKNDRRLLPLSRSTGTIAVIGAHADVGVLSGGGSSIVYPIGGNAVPSPEPRQFPGPILYHPSSPLAAIRSRLSAAAVVYADGVDVAAAARLAAESDTVLLFARQWSAESIDSSLTLADRQDDLIAAVAAANPRTVVILETGGPVLMPWLDDVGAVLEAWYPGSRGGEAIARVLFGEVDAAGRLPATFPRSESQLPRPQLDTGRDNRTFDVDYFEGAAVGYKWFERQKLTPLFAFGYGLSYTTFAYRQLQVTTRRNTVRVRFTVSNIGGRPGMDVPQVYVGPLAGDWEAPRRLVGWRKVSLRPGQSQRITLTVDPRLLARYDGVAGAWRIAAGRYTVTLGASSRDVAAQAMLTLRARQLPDRVKPSRSPPSTARGR